MPVLSYSLFSMEWLGNKLKLKKYWDVLEKSVDKYTILFIKYYLTISWVIAPDFITGLAFR